MQLLSEMLIDAVEDTLTDEELEGLLEANPQLIDRLDGGQLFEEAAYELDSLQELKIPKFLKKLGGKIKRGIKRLFGKKKAKAGGGGAGGGKAGGGKKGGGGNLKVGNPGNNPWSDYGARGVPGAKGTGGTTMHDVLGSGGRSKTGEWKCKCKNYHCKCSGPKGTKEFDINRSRHLSYNRAYKRNAHPRQDHPRSVGGSTGKR